MSTPQSPAAGGAPGTSQNNSAALNRRIGTTIGGRYRVISLLGAGELGGMYLVEHTQLRKNMALKVLSAEVLPSPELVTRFESEALATAPLEHPSIVAPTDVGRTEDGALFLVFEYLSGKTLREVLAAGPLPLPRVLQLAQQILSALVRAHAAGVLHQALKPEKIVLQQRDGDGELVKIRDFGLAKIRAEALGATQWDPSRSQAPTRHATAFGAPRYMAPEQTVGGEVDGRADLYTLGVILYELLTGTPPFLGEEPSELLKQHVVDKVPALSERAPQLQVPAALEQLLMQLLAKSPDERPATARAVLEAVDQLAVAQGLGAAPALPADPSGKGDESLASALAALAGPAADADAADGPAAAPGRRLGGGESESPLAAALGVGQSAPRPKLRAPSVIDLAILQPDAANPALLAPAPPPSASERVLDGSKEVARLGREVLLPAVKQGGERAWTAARTHSEKGWQRLLQLIRPRLPPKLREVSDRTIGLAVGGTAALLVLLLLIIAWPAQKPPKPVMATGAAQTGFASEREMEHGVAQGAGTLAALVAKYPRDARCHRALVRAYAAKKNYVEALRALVPLLQLDPSAQSDEAMSQIVAEAVFVPEISDSALAFLEMALGPHGVDVLIELFDKTPVEPWHTKLSQSLAKPAVRQLASPEALLLLDLRAAARCEQKKALLPRAGEQGDARVQRYLQELQSPTGCGTSGKADCWPCLRKGAALQNALTAIAQRGGAPAAAPGR